MAALTLFGATRVVATRNVVRAALSLVLALSGVAVVFLLLTAELITWVQILIYVGAVIVLLLFGLMLTRAPIGRTAADDQQKGVAALVAGGLFLVTSTVLWQTFRGQTVNLQPELFSTEGLGNQLFTRFVLPFEVVSVLLLAALVGAVVLAKRD